MFFLYDKVLRRPVELAGNNGHAERVLANLKTENLRRLFRSARAAQSVTGKKGAG
jgi:hypothetical protein